MANNKLPNQLDANLANGQLMDDWLAGWVLASARDPGSVKAVITEESAVGTVVELQNDQGIAQGGILFKDNRGSVHVLGTLDPDDRNRTLRRSANEMRMALDAAAERKRTVKERLDQLQSLKAVLPIIILVLLGFMGLLYLL